MVLPKAVLGVLWVASGASIFVPLCGHNSSFGLNFLLGFAHWMSNKKIRIFFLGDLAGGWVGFVWFSCRIVPN